MIPSPASLASFFSHLLFCLSLVRIKPFWSPIWSLNTPGMLSPRDFCPCYFLCLECSSFRYLHYSLPHLLQGFAQRSPSQWGFHWLHLKFESFPTPLLSTLFCFFSEHILPSNLVYSFCLLSGSPMTIQDLRRPGFCFLYCCIPCAKNSDWQIPGAQLKLVEYMSEIYSPVQCLTCIWEEINEY